MAFYRLSGMFVLPHFAQLKADSPIKVDRVTLITIYINIYIYKKEHSMEKYH